MWNLYILHLSTHIIYSPRGFHLTVPSLTLTSSIPPPPLFSLVSRGDLCVQHPRAGGSVWGSGAERYVWRGPAEGPRPGGLRAAEGIHLHHSGSRLRFWPRGHRGQKVPQVSKRDTRVQTAGPFLKENWYTHIFRFLAINYRFLLSCTCI